MITPFLGIRTFLKLGILIVLTIKYDKVRKTPTNIQVGIHASNNVKTATKLPASVIGTPLKECNDSSVGVMLYLAKRKAPANGKTPTKTTPSIPNSKKYVYADNKAGATPNETISARESSCFPKSLDTFNILAARPSNASRSIAIKIKRTAFFISPLTI